MRNENVIWLQIPMNDIVFMEIPKPFQYLSSTLFIKISFYAFETDLKFQISLHIFTVRMQVAQPILFQVDVSELLSKLGLLLEGKPV